jgi:hypothetical protein
VAIFALQDQSRTSGVAAVRIEPRGARRSCRPLHGILHILEAEPVLAADLLDGRTRADNMPDVDAAPAHCTEATATGPRGLAPGRVVCGAAALPDVLAIGTGARVTEVAGELGGVKADGAKLAVAVSRPPVRAVPANGTSQPS